MNTIAELQRRWEAAINRWPVWQRILINAVIVGLSASLCLALMPLRLPGMSLLGIGPNWALIWVAAWSICRVPWLGALAGCFMGLAQDSLVTASAIAPAAGNMEEALATIAPSHAFGLAIAGFLIAQFQRRRFIEDDVVALVLLIFGTAILTETITALLYIFQDETLGSVVWPHHQRLALCSAILSSLWGPAVYFPLKIWWQAIANVEKSA
ncbi:MAG: rod shape-determining protein MreD [Cyanobacteria bacterium P01_D01_bin.73]